MSNVVTLKVKPRPSRSAQTGLMSTSYNMYLMMADIDGMEAHGGCPVAGLNKSTRRALFKRGLIAYYYSHVSRICLSPVGRNVLRSWRYRLSQ